MCSKTDFPRHSAIISACTVTLPLLILYPFVITPPIPDRIFILLSTLSQKGLNVEKLSMKKWLITVFGSACACSVQAFDWDIISLRTTLSRPDTSQSLIHRGLGEDEQKTLFHLSPTNNERLGFFLDINGIEVGYAVDVRKDDIETDTQNFLLSYRKLKNARITLNYQTLEGLTTRAEHLSGTGATQVFSPQTKSTKLELFGQHNLYTFGNKASLFEHFFLNRPQLSHQFDWSLGINAGWSIKRLKLEATDSILIDTAFLTTPAERVNQLDSVSYSADVGPFLSISAPNNLHFFAEYKWGKGVIENLSDRVDLKESGDEKARAYGLGMSWTSPDEKLLVLLRGWKQEGRHVETSFGDLSAVYFF